MHWRKIKLSEEHEQIRTFLLTGSLFKRLSVRSQAFARFVSSLSIKTVSRGEQIYAPGLSTNTVYIVYSGEIMISLNQDAPARDRQVAVHGRGSIFGEVSLLSGEAHSAHAIATVQSRLLVIPGKHLFRLMKEEPSVGEAMSQLLSRRLNHNLRSSLGTPSRVYTVIYPENPLRGSLLCRQLSIHLNKETPDRVLQIHFNSRVQSEHKTSIQLPALLNRLHEIDASTLHRIFRNPEDGIHSVDGYEFLNRYYKQDYNGETLGVILSHLKKHYSVILINLEADERKGRLKEVFKSTNRTVLIRSTNPSLSETAKVHWNTAIDSLTDTIQKEPEKLLTATDETSPHKKSMREILRLDPIVSDSYLNHRNHLRLYSRSPDSLIMENDPDLEREIGRLSRKLNGTSRGIALGGGGARSLAHIGVIEVLEQEGLEFDAIAGSSMGAVIGAGFAMGLSAREVRDLIHNSIPDGKSILDKNLPLISFFRGKKIEQLLQSIFGETRFEDLKYPFYCNASDLYTGQSVIFHSGLLRTALRASTSIPGYFPPVEGNDHALVDGSVLDSIPASVLEKNGYSKILGVSVTPSIERPQTTIAASKDKNLLQNLFQYFSLPPILKIFTRAMSIQNMALIQMGARNVDYLLHPRIESFELFDFERIDEVIAAGRETTIANLAEIKDVFYRPGADDRH